MNSLKDSNFLNGDISLEFVRDAEGAKLARMSIGKFRQLAEEFNAVYRIGRTRLTDWKKFKQGLEAYRA